MAENQNQPQGRLEDRIFLYKEITWEIPNILPLPNLVDSVIRSSEFKFADSTWALSMYPFGQKRYKTESFIDIMIGRRQSDVPRQQVFYKIFFKTSKGKEYKAFKNFHTFTSFQDESGVIRYVPHHQLDSNNKALLPGGTLTIICQMRTRSVENKTPQREAVVQPDKSINCDVSVQTSVEAPSKKFPPAAPDNKVLRDLQDLLDSGKCSDVILSVKGLKFEAHRAILCARSQVFASMLRHIANENTNKVAIENCLPEDFSVFLDFLYSGRTKGLTRQNVLRLYKVADEYNVQDLKFECIKLLKRHISLENFCDVFKLSLQYKETDLYEHSAGFFKQNMAKVIATPKWLALLAENIAEVNELLVKALAVGESSNPTTPA